MSRKKPLILIYFQVKATQNQYKELFPYSQLNHKYVVMEASNSSNNFEGNIKINLSFFAKKIHALLHLCELQRRRFSSLFYLERASSYFPNKFDFKSIKLREIDRKSWPEQILVLFFSNYLGVSLIKKVLISIFKIEYSLNKNKFKDFSLFILPYTGGISIEWDFLVWVAKQKKINSIAIQENWDNLSSKQFLFQSPNIFLVFGKQSGSHLRTLHGYTGEIFEIGCLRLEGLYEQRRKNEAIPKIKDKFQMESVTKILFVDSGMSEGDLKILNKLSDFLTGKNSSKGHKFKVIYRTHPKIQISADRQFFLDSIADLPNIEVFQPNVNESNFDRISQLSDAKIVISIFSTYILEGSILNKTCIIPTFWVGFQNHSPTKLIDDISHFHGMSLLDGINIASSFSELINLIEGYTKEIKCSNELRLLKWFCEDLNTRNEITNLVNKYI